MVVTLFLEQKQGSRDCRLPISDIRLRKKSDEATKRRSDKGEKANRALRQWGNSVKKIES